MSIIATLFVATVMFSQDCQIPQVPYAGESVWSTTVVVSPTVETRNYTVNGKSYAQKYDTTDQFPMKLKWVITDRLYQFGSEGVRIFKLTNGAVANDGQAATYSITEEKKIRKEYVDKNGVTKTKVVATYTEPEMTLMVRCDEGRFEGIYIITANGGYTKFQ